MVWCPKHTSKDSVVNGMYMPSPRGHAKWEADRAERIAKRKAKKFGADTGTETTKKQKGDGPSKLALKETLKSIMLCTKFMRSDVQADNLVGEVMGTADNASANAKDGEVEEQLKDSVRSTMTVADESIC